MYVCVEGGFCGAGTSPGAKLVLTAPYKVPKLLVVGVIVVLDSVEQRRWDFHQSVVGQLLLLATCVAIVQVVHLVSDLWGGGKDVKEFT